MNELSTTEARQLERCEAVIERGLHTFLEVGTALCEIRDRRLYRAGHETFEAYCRERWGMGRAHAYRMIDAAKVVENLSPIGDIPRSESVARPLLHLDPPQQREAWSRAVETAPGGKPTAAHVKATVDELFPRRGWTDSELERKASVEGGQAVTAHIGEDARLIEWAQQRGLYERIDRQSDWGNPFVLGQDGDRERVCEAYRGYLRDKPELRRRYGELRGKVLGCWCYPERCHGDVLIEEIAAAPVLGRE
jgi:hypothetical protein